MTNATAPAPYRGHQPWAQQQRKRVFWPVVGLVLVSIMAVGAVQLGVSDLSGGAVVNAVLLALVPVVVVVGAFLWLDRWEPEPGVMLAVAFLWGGGVAALGAMLINTAVGVEYGIETSAIVSAPLAEEALKGTFLIGILWRQRHQLDGLVDGVVYAGVVAAGFAFVENIIYLGRAFDTSASDGYAVFVVRGLLSPFAHPLFTVFIGIAVGLAARRNGGAAARMLLVLVGYGVAVGLHALWNASTLWDDGRNFVATYAVVMVPLFGAMVILALWQRRRERRVIATHLPEFARAGLVSWNEVPLLSTMKERRHWRSAARRQSGKDAYRAVRDYQTAVTELAFFAERVRGGEVPDEFAARYAEVTDAVVAARQRAVAAALPRTA